MDFSLDVSQDWLERRRELVAQASRKIRLKKKQEREELSEENSLLKEDRTRLMERISELETQAQAEGELKVGFCLAFCIVDVKSFDILLWDSLRYLCIIMESLLSLINDNYLISNSFDPTELHGHRHVHISLAS
jgi:hypothetical protein